MTREHGQGRWREFICLVPSCRRWQRRYCSARLCLYCRGGLAPAPPAGAGEGLDAGTRELLAAVDALAVAMRQKLLANRHKPGLDACSYTHLLERLAEEARELRDALGPYLARPRRRPLDSILDEAADVANFALLCWVKARREAAELPARERA